MSFNNKNILITGGSGFIGSKIVNYLIQNNQDVKITVFDKNPPIEKNDQISFIKGNLGNNSDLRKMDDCNFDYIFHQGAITDTTVMDEALMLQVNTESFHYFVELARKNKSVLVYASSADTYGNTPVPNIVGRGEEPTNIYGVSKLKMDYLACDYMKKYPELKIVGLRYFNVYGPGEERKGRMASMILQLFKRMNSNKNPRLFKYGEQKRDFVYVKDVVQANIKAAMSGKSGVYNAGYGKARTFNYVVNILNQNMNKRLEIEYFDNPYDFYQNHTEAGVKNDIVHKPEINLEDGIQKYIRYLVRDKVMGLIIPYRDREEHLNIILPYLKEHFKMHNIKYKIYIIEQGNDNVFYKVLLNNIGAKLCFDEVDYFCFHDVDALPDPSADYSYTYSVRHLCTQTFDNHDSNNVITADMKYGNINFDDLNYDVSRGQVGGVVIINKEIFNKHYFDIGIDGYGYEDALLYNRLLNAGISVEKPLYKYFLMYHEMEKKKSKEAYLNYLCNYHYAKIIDFRGIEPYEKKLVETDLKYKILSKQKINDSVYQYKVNFKKRRKYLLTEYLRLLLIHNYFKLCSLLSKLKIWN